MAHIRNAMFIIPLLLVAGCSINYPYELTVTVVSLDDGTPLPDIEVKLLSRIGEESAGVTNNDGICILKADLDTNDFVGGEKGNGFLHGFEKDKPWRVSIKHLNNDFVVTCPPSPKPTKGMTLVAASMVVAVKQP